MLIPRRSVGSFQGLDSELHYSNVVGVSYRLVIHQGEEGYEESNIRRAESWLGATCSHRPSNSSDDDVEEETPLWHTYSGSDLMFPTKNKDNLCRSRKLFTGAYITPVCRLRDSQ